MLRKYYFNRFHTAHQFSTPQLDGKVEMSQFIIWRCKVRDNRIRLVSVGLSLPSEFLKIKPDMVQNRNKWSCLLYS